MTTREEEWQRQVADATLALSTAVLNFGTAVAGVEALNAAIRREVLRPGPAADVDTEADDDPPGPGVDEDPRRAPEDADPWQCPDGASDLACSTLHDHYPAPDAEARRRRQR